MVILQFVVEMLLVLVGIFWKYRLKLVGVISVSKVEKYLLGFIFLLLIHFYLLLLDDLLFLLFHNLHILIFFEATLLLFHLKK